MDELIDKIKSLIASHGDTQATLANAWNMAESTMSTWVNRPNLRFLHRLAKHYKMELWEFFAPPGTVLPNMTPLQKEILKIYNDLPEELRQEVLTSLTSVFKAYVFGKNHPAK